MKRLRFLEGIKHIRLARSASYAVLGALVVLIGTFAAWQFTKIFSPSSLINTSNPEVRLKSSDHDAGGSLLSNTMCNDPNPPCNYVAPYYDDPESVHLIPIQNGLVKLPRIQGEVWYR